MDDHTYWVLINKYLSNTLSLEETEELLNCLAADKEREDLFNELGETWRIVKKYPVEFPVDSRGGWKRLKEELSASENTDNVQAANYWEALRRVIATIKERNIYSKNATDIKLQ